MIGATVFQIYLTLALSCDDWCVFCICNLVPNIESSSRQWPLLSKLLPDLVFLGRRGINKLLLCKMHVSACSVLSQGFIIHVFCRTPFPNQWNQLRTTSSEMKLAVSAWVSINQLLLNDHK